MARWWDDPAGPVIDAGAVRLCDGATGCLGPITPANSLTGFRWEPVPGGANVVALANDDYVVHSSSWGTPSTPEAGAVTHCSGDTGCVGEVSASNSLVGTTSGDRVGMGVTPLSDGNYVVQSPTWNKGAISDAGAVTWCSGATGCAVGPVTAANSLTGATQLDRVGGTSDEFGLIPTPLVPLPGGAYVVESELFNRPGIPVAGAATWCGAGGVGCTGEAVTTANSLVGSSLLVFFEGEPIVHVGDGAFVVPAPAWTDPVTQALSVGAAVYCDAATHCQGQTVSAANALTGSAAGDEVGSSVTALANGNYVVGSPSWSTATLDQVGAATFCDGTTGCQGAVTAANSFVGTNALDQVGGRTTALSNGNYVVASRSARIGTLSAAGAVTFCSGTTGCFGAPDAANSLVGASALDFVGIVHPLPDGNYVVAASLYDEGAIASVGAVTWCSGTSGCTGPVGIANSLLGTAADDRVGSDGVLAFPDGRFVVRSRNFDNGPIANAGAITFGDGETALIGRIDETNSVIGSILRDLYPLGSSQDSSIAYDPVRERFAVGAPGSNRVILVELPEPGTGLALGVACGTLGLLSRRNGRVRDRHRAAVSEISTPQREPAT